MKFKWSILALLVLFSVSGSISAQHSQKISQKLSSYLSATDKSAVHAWVYFTDKGTQLDKKLEEVAATLPDHAYFRRRKLIKRGDIVDFRDIPVEDNYVRDIAKSVIRLRKKSRWLNAVSVEATAAEIEALTNFSFVKKIDLVRTVGTFREAITGANEITPRGVDDHTLDYGASLTQLEQINVPAAHDLGYTGNGVIICVMDAGFNNLEHPVFDQLDTLGSWDFVNDDWNVDDEEDMGTGSHGTKTLSTIGGYAEGELIGPAYGAQYVLAKTENTDSETQVEEDNWIAAVEWAEFNYGPDITSTSLGYIDFDDGTGYSRDELDGNTAPITIAADIAAGKGILVVNSAGNSGFVSLGAPSDGDSVLAVGAVDAFGIVSGFSSRGPTGDGRIKPDVMAMGVSVHVASSYDSTYSNSNGTSFSCPLTAGTAALLMEMVPEAGNMDIYEALKMTANNATTPNNDYGWGIINLMAARDYLQQPRILHTPLTYTENMTADYEVLADIRSLTPLKEDSLFLVYRVDGGEWQQKILQYQQGTIYSQQITASGNPSFYEYYLSATSESGTKRLPAGETEYFSFSTAVDDIPPVIAHVPLATYYDKLWGQATIKADITDNLGVNPYSVAVDWDVNGNPRIGFELENTFGNHFEGVFPFNPDLPPIAPGDVITYKFKAQDIANTPNETWTDEFSFEIADRISFEQDTFSHNWVFTGDEKWFITDAESQDGNQSMRAGIVETTGNSDISLTFESAEPDTVSFYRKNNLPLSCYYLFSIDSQPKTFLTQDTSDWVRDTFFVEPGVHKLTWGYARYVTVPDSIANTVWIDNITLPRQLPIHIIVTGVDDLAGNNLPFSLSPNPAMESISVELPASSTEYQLNIFDGTGKLMATYSHLRDSKQIDVGGWMPGTYFVQLISAGKTGSKKLIIMR